MKIRNVLFLLFISANALPAQNNAWQIKLAGGDMLSNVILRNVAGDSLAISQVGQTRRLAIDDIIEMRKAKKSKFWKGAGIGFLAGAVAGGLIAATTYEEPKNTLEEIVSELAARREGTIVIGGLIGGTSGFILGGLVGSSAGKEKVYDFSDKTREQKLAALRSMVP